jgi:hypothetical protein
MNPVGMLGPENSKVLEVNSTTQYLAHRLPDKCRHAEFSSLNRK